jgi:hypothetical protein
MLWFESEISLKGLCVEDLVLNAAVFISGASGK